MPGPQPVDELITTVLGRSHSVAVVGASRDPGRPSNEVMAYLADRSTFELHPVNPNESVVLGRESADSLNDLDVAPDIVCVFRRPEHCVAVAEDAIAVGARTLWLQLGVVNDDAAALARDAGLDVVMNRCLKIEHQVRSVH